MIFLLSLFFTQPAYSQVFFEKPIVQNQKFDCSQDALCEFEVTEQHYQIKFTDSNEVSFGTRMFAKYKTKNPNDLEKYAVVQFIKGCVFQSEIINNEIKYYANFQREYFGELKPYRHAQFQVDSVDLDPMYNNTPSGYEHWNTRHGLYRWNEQVGSFDPDSEKLFYKEKPVTSELYVVDRPGTAFFQNARAKNISLNFTTCIYKTEEVPARLDPNDVNFAKALKCFDWKSSFVYDHAKSQFYRPSEIHPFCS